jgi:hypothetical protein
MQVIPVGNPAQVGTYGQLNLAVYYAAVNTPSPFTAGTASLLPSAWTESAGITHQISPIPGNTLAATFTLANATGAANTEVMVVGWTGAFTDWNSAFTAGTGLLGWTGSTLSTGALHWSNGTGAPNGSPPVTPVALTYGAGGFNGLVLTPVPEPASFALAGLGLASLLIFRRRK